MFKKILVLLCFILIFSIRNISISYAEENTLSEKNIVIKAFEERKKKILNIINGGEISQEIKKLKLDIISIESGEELNLEIKNKFISEIEKIEKNIEKNKKKLDKKELEKFLEESRKSIELKNNLVEKLNSEIEDNKINKEKNEILLKKLSKFQHEEDLKNNKEANKKYYIFFTFTLFLVLVHIILYFLLKYEKIKKSKGVYIKFFLIFSYTIFLIWFFFYLYPELSIFLIFISGYLLAINAHLIASFVGSTIILNKYKIGDVIKFGNFKGQIIRITTISTVLIPMTDEGIFSNKPIVIPNYRLLKEEVIKDDSPEKIIHKYILKYSLDLQLDTLKLVEGIEQNILIKHLHFRLNTLNGNDESFRTGMGFDRFGRIEISFVWKGEDILNKRIERKIMGFFNRTVELRRKELEEEAETKEESKKIKEIEREKLLKIEEKNKKHKRKNLKKNKYLSKPSYKITNREVESLDGVNNWKNKK